MQAILWHTLYLAYIGVIVSCKQYCGIYYILLLLVSLFHASNTTAYIISCCYWCHCFMQAILWHTLYLAVIGVIVSCKQYYGIHNILLLLVSLFHASNTTAYIISCCYWCHCFMQEILWHILYLVVIGVIVSCKQYYGIHYILLLLVSLFHASNTVAYIISCCYWCHCFMQAILRHTLYLAVIGVIVSCKQYYGIHYILLLLVSLFHASNTVAYIISCCYWCHCFMQAILWHTLYLAVIGVIVSCKQYCGIHYILLLLVSLFHASNTTAYIISCCYWCHCFMQAILWHTLYLAVIGVIVSCKQYCGIYYILLLLVSLFHASNTMAYIISCCYWCHCFMQAILRHILYLVVIGVIVSCKQYCGIHYILLLLVSLFHASNTMAYIISCCYWCHCFMQAILRHILYLVVIGVIVSCKQYYGIHYILLLLVSLFHASNTMAYIISCCYWCHCFMQAILWHTLYLAVIGVIVSCKQYYGIHYILLLLVSLFHASNTMAYIISCCYWCHCFMQAILWHTLYLVVIGVIVSCKQYYGIHYILLLLVSLFHASNTTAYIISCCYWCHCFMQAILWHIIYLVVIGVIVSCKQYYGIYYILLLLVSLFHASNTVAYIISCCYWCHCFMQAILWHIIYLAVIGVIVSCKQYYGI